MVNTLTPSPVTPPLKALFLKGVKPYSDMGKLVQIARAEGKRIFKCEKVNVLDIIACNNVAGYVAVVQASGGKSMMYG